VSAAEPVYVHLGRHGRLQAEKQIPAVEWWDAYFLKDDVYPADAVVPNGDANGAMHVDGVDGEKDPYRREIITHLVQHPVPPAPPREEVEPKPKEMYLTKEVRLRTRTTTEGYGVAAVPDAFDAVRGRAPRAPQ